MTRVLEGTELLPIAGTSYRQETLWELRESTGNEIVATLIPEPSNPHDHNAIGVQVNGAHVGYLPREIAEWCLPGLYRLMAQHLDWIALRGVLIGGGDYGYGRRSIGIRLRWNPTDFGGPVMIRQTRIGTPSPGR